MCLYVYIVFRFLRLSVVCMCMYGGGVLVPVFFWWCGGVFGVVSCGGVFVVVVFEQASKTSISCDASYNFHRTRFQNERFARCFRQFSQKKLVSCEASSKFHRRSFQNERFARGFLQISKNHASKTSVSHDASDNFARKSFQNDRFVRSFLQISQNKLPKRAFRAMLPTIFTKNLSFATVSRNRHTASCERVHPPKAKCASHYNAVHSQISKCTFRYSGVHKNV